MDDSAMDHGATDTHSKGSDPRHGVPTRMHRAKHVSTTGPAHFAWRSGARPRTGARRASATLNVVVSRVALVLGLAVLLLAAQLKAPPNDRAAQRDPAAPFDSALSAAPEAGTSSLLPQPSSVDGPAPPVGAATSTSSPAPSPERNTGGVTSRPRTAATLPPGFVPATPSVPFSQRVDASRGGRPHPPSPGRTSAAPSRSSPPPSSSRYYLTDRYFAGQRASACLAPVDPRAGARVVQRPCSGGTSWTRVINQDGRLSLRYSDALCLGLANGAVQYASPLVLVPCGSDAEPRWGIDAPAHRVYVAGAPRDASPTWCVTGYDDVSESGTFDDLLFPCSRDALNQDVTLLPAPD